MAKKNSPYFEDFINMMGYSVKASKYLQEVLKDFDAGKLTACRKKMHEIEHAEDEIKHDMMSRLVKEFITPIDREDIIQLANELDNVTDIIEDVLIRMYMYNVKNVRTEALAFTDVIVRCCDALYAAMQEFPNFQKSTTLKNAIIDVNRMEEEGDDIYIDAVRKLYAEESDVLQVAVWGKIFDRLEECCDACEHVADLMEMVVMKNS